MRDFAIDSWNRALDALRAATHLLSISPDAPASRAYYAAFHAVTAAFALRDQTFSKHAQVRAAVHRDLVKHGLWPVELGQDYDFLLALRETGDYGGRLHVSRSDAEQAISKAKRILDVVRSSLCDLPAPDRLNG